MAGSSQFIDIRFRQQFPIAENITCKKIDVDFISGFSNNTLNNRRLLLLGAVYYNNVPILWIIITDLLQKKPFPIQ